MEPDPASAVTVDIVPYNDNEYTDPYETSTCMNNMFGSLLGLAEAPEVARQCLTENWYKIMRRWYPGLHQNVYSAPPVHFKAVAYKPKPEKPDIPEEPYLRFGMRMYLPTQYSTTKDDEAQQRVLWTLSEYARKKGTAAFILSNMEFQNYLNKSYEWEDPNTSDYPKPNIRNQLEEGEVDVLVIDKKQGIFILEVKAVGDPEEERKVDRSVQIQELSDKLTKKLGCQVQKEKDVIRKLLSDLDPNRNIKIRTGVVLPNTARELLEETLKQKLAWEKLRTALGLADKSEISRITLCSDDLPDRKVTAEDRMDEELFQRVDRVLEALRGVEGESTEMEDDLYEKIVARFCGPLTTVKIYTEKTYPRVKLEVTIIPPKENIKGKSNGKSGKAKTPAQPKRKVRVVPEEVHSMAGAARIMARRFSELVLLEEQIEILQKNEEFVHIEGPPGTGKTLLLLLRILTWLDDGHLVWLLSLSPPSRSVTHVLLEQVKRMVKKYNSESESEKILGRLRLFMIIRPEKTLDKEYFKRRMMKFRLRAKEAPEYSDAGYPRPPTLPPVAAEHDRKVCMVLDESGMNGKGQPNFFKEVAKSHLEKHFRCPDFDKGLSVWSASVERVGRPAYVARPGETTKDKFGVLYDLTVPLRCPPTVQRALMLVQPSLDQKNVCCFQEDAILSHPAKQGGCRDREQYAADGLPVFLIAHGDHKKNNEDIWFCFECGDMLADYLKNELRIGQEECDCDDQPYCYEEPAQEKCPKCKKLTKGTLPIGDIPLKYNDVMIVATQYAFQFSVPIGGFVHAMAKKKLKVAVNTSREDGDAPIPPDDVILIVDLTSVHGLERAVIIIIPEVNPPPPLPRSLLLNPLYEDKLPPNPATEKERLAPKLPPHITEAIDRGQADGKDFVAFTGDGMQLEDPPSDGEDSLPNLPKSIDPTFVKHDPKVRAAMEAGANSLHVTGNDKVEDVHPAGTGADVEMKDASSSGDSKHPPPLEEDVEMTDVSGAPKQQGHPPAPPATSAEASSNQRSQAAGSQEKSQDPYRYTDAKSKTHIQAAIDSMSLQSRQDMFYIGSRAVCQLILVHRGKDPDKNPDPDQTAEPMQTNIS